MPEHYDPKTKILSHGIARRETGLADVEESAGANQVLRAAALTYLTGLGQRLGTWPFSR